MTSMQIITFFDNFLWIAKNNSRQEQTNINKQKNKCDQQYREKQPKIYGLKITPTKLFSN